MLNLENHFAALGEDFHQLKSPDPVSEPYLVDFEPDVARLLGLDAEAGQNPEFVEYFGGNKILPGSTPLAMAYTGHQFGVYNPRIGDGRAQLLGEVKNADGEYWEISLKGCGPTRYARGFDGRATLRASIREHLASEALHGLGVPTTRSLAVVGIRDLIHRETPELAAVLTRVARSHIRFGSFENFHYTNRPSLGQKLADYAIERYYPQVAKEADRYRLFYREVILRTARLIAHWQSVGFVHGVMNTDNMSIVGDTFDYGPYGFMDAFNPNFIPNHSDSNGRYCFARQPEIGFWNLQKLGTALGALIEEDVVQQELAGYQPEYNRIYRDTIAAKLGIQIVDSAFHDLAGALFQLLFSNGADYTNFFRRLGNFPDGNMEPLLAMFQNQKEINDWLAQYRSLLDREDRPHEERQEGMNAVNPKFILRNYLAHQALEKAVKEADFSEVRNLRLVLRDPFSDRPKLFQELGVDPESYCVDTPKRWIGMQVSCSA